MKSRNKVVVILAVCMLGLSLVCSLFLEDEIGGKISNSVSIITAIIGAVALFLQFKRDRRINVSSFLMELNGQVLENEHFTDIDQKLEFEHQYGKDYLNEETDKYWVINLLSWHEGLCDIVLNGALTIKDVDTLFGYRFFMLMNNKNIWEFELKEELKYYPALCLLYPRWYDYRKNNGEFIINNESNLYDKCVEINKQNKGFDKRG